MSSRTFNVGLVGLGWWGQRLFNFFDSLDYVNMAAVADKRNITPEEFDLRGARLYSDTKEMLDKEKLDAIIVATPPALHLEPTRLAAERGVHVFCEKPMASTVEDCDAMIEVCRKNNVKLFIAFKHRYARACRYVKDNLEKFGRPLWAMYTYPLFKVDDPGWKFKPDECKGIIVENVVHSIDNIRYLVGDIERVYAEGNTAIFKGAAPPDSAVFTMRFANGAVGAIGCGCTGELAVIREYLDIHYENATIQMWGMTDFPFDLRVCWREGALIDEHHFEGSDGVMEEIRHFFKCIESDEEPYATGIDGREALRVALRVIESIEMKKVVQVR